MLGHLADPIWDKLHSLNPAQKPSAASQHQARPPKHHSHSGKEKPGGSARRPQTEHKLFVLASATPPLWRKPARARALQAGLTSSEDGSRQAESLPCPSHGTRARIPLTARCYIWKLHLGLFFFFKPFHSVPSTALAENSLPCQKKSAWDP